MAEPFPQPPAPGGEYAAAPPPLNTVERLIADEFNDPILFDANRESWGSPAYFGVDHPGDWGDVDYSRHILAYPEETWLSYIYGSRVTATLESDNVSIETASLDTLHAIHVRLAETVLEDEGMHVATPVIPPEPESGTGSHANNDLWLQMIHEGKWPIMATSLLPEDGEPQYNSHDYGDYHLGNLALFPREIQDIISHAAGLEINWRKAHGPDAILRPSNAGRDDRDPFAGGLRGESYYTSGIDKIDNMTDIPGYFELLNYAMHGEGGNAPQERLAMLVDNIASGNIAEDQQRLKGTMAVIQRQIGDLVNFITLHEEGHVTTQENVEKAMADFLHGVARVAEKIQGTYAEPVDTPVSEAD